MLPRADRVTVMVQDYSSEAGLPHMKAFDPISLIVEKCLCTFNSLLSLCSLILSFFSIHLQSLRLWVCMGISQAKSDTHSKVNNLFLLIL